MDLSKFNIEALSRELEGQRLQEFLGEYSFKNLEDYEAQTPSIYPLGKLHLSGDDGGVGMGQRWLNEDETIFVDTDPRGIITWVTEVY